LEPNPWFRFLDVVAEQRFLKIHRLPVTMRYTLRPYRTGLYHLASDPGEQENVAPRHPEVARRLRGKLVAWLQETAAYRPFSELEDAGGPIPLQQLSPEEIKSLKALGYLQ
jgi:hypothetical protein